MRTFDPTKRYDFLLFVEVIDGNPNGDPDGGNRPRTDPETQHGLITDTCIKCKLRNYVSLAKDKGATIADGYERYVKQLGVLNREHARAYDALKITTTSDVVCPVPDKLKSILTAGVTLPEGFELVPVSDTSDEMQLVYDGTLDAESMTAALEQIEEALGADARKLASSLKAKSKPASATRGQVEQAKNWMCKTFFDVRAFGGVMNTKIRCGTVRGPIQLTFARSIDPIVPVEHCITRAAVTKETDALKKETEMGKKWTVPYGLYKSRGFFTPSSAKISGFSADDLALTFDGLEGMFEIDRSAARGFMATRLLVIFEHQSQLGDAPAHECFARVTVEKIDPARPARAFEDYRILLDGKPIPSDQIRVVAPAKHP